MEVDKKRVSDAVRFVLVPRAGQALIQGIALDELKRPAHCCAVVKLGLFTKVGTYPTCVSS